MAFGEQVGNGIYFREQGNKGQYLMGNMGTKTILGNREHKKTIFRFLEPGTSQFISCEQENRYP